MIETSSGFEQGLLRSLFFLYAGGLVAYLAYFVLGAQTLRKAATAFALAAAVITFLDLVLRGLASHRLPTATLIEFALLMLLALTVGFLVADRQALSHKIDLGLIGAVIMGICFGLLLFLFFELKVGRATAETIPPILQSSWRTFHVLCGAISYGGVVLAFAFALLYLIRVRLHTAEKSSGMATRLPEAEALDRLCYLSIAYSFPFLTLLNITGAIWAAMSWNRYWGWDPKEVWGLITWLVYALYLHARLRRKWKGPRIALVAVIGFGIMMFTFLGVNYLPRFEGSLHSYARGSRAK